MSRISHLFGGALLAGLGGLLLVGAASAQTSPDGTIEEIIVTGSYIRQTPEDATLPVDVINSEELFNQGSPSVVELVRSLGASSGIDGETNQFTSNGLNGIANINLRGLGVGRTLVLLNGRRNVWSAYPVSEQVQLFVDINQFPAIALSRVELLKDGAAATYGSDAIAGVANFITRSEFEGFEISSAYKNIQGSDGDFDIGAIAGWAFGNSNLVVSGGWTRRSELTVQERADWALQPRGTGGNDKNYTGIPNPGGFFPIPNPGSGNPAAVGGDRSSGADGIFGTPDDIYPPYVIDPNILAPTVPAFRDPRCADFVGTANAAVSGLCTYSYLYFDNLIEKEERFQVLAEFTHAISDDHTFSAEVLYADTDVPEWKTSPSYPPQTLHDVNPITGRFVPSYHPGLAAMAAIYDGSGPDSTTDGDGNPVPGLDFTPYLDADDDGVADTAADCVTADDPYGHKCNTLRFFGRPKGVRGPSNVGFRRYDMTRIALGLEGALTENLDYTTSLLWSENNGERGTPDTYAERWNLALRGFGGEGCDPALGMPGEGNCLWYNPFSNSIEFPQAARFDGQLPEGEANPDYNEDVANTDELFNWMEDVLTDPIESRLIVFDAVISGDTELTAPSGDTVKFAAGIQWRKEEYAITPDTINDLTQNPCVTRGENMRWRDAVAASGIGYGEPDAPLCDGGTWVSDTGNYLDSTTSTYIADTIAAMRAAATTDVTDDLDTPDVNEMQVALMAAQDAAEAAFVNSFRDNDYEGSGSFIFLAARTPYDNDQDILGVFGELFVPFTENLEGQFSVRYEDYGSAVGDTIDPKVALRWQASDLLALRGSLSTTFRGPGLNQLGGRATSLAFVTPTGTFKAVDTFGNPDLKPESATTLNLGGIFDTGELYVSLDYWRFEFKDSIIREGLSALVEEGFTDGVLNGMLDDRFDLSSGSVRAADIQRVSTYVINGPDINTDGLDFVLRYSFDVGPGTAELSATGTWTFSYDLGSYQAFNSDVVFDPMDALGKSNADASFLRSLPELKATFGAKYEMESHLVNLVVNYVSEYEDRITPVRDIESHVTVDLHYNMDIGGALNIGALEGSTFWLSAYNIADEDPPFARNDLNYDPFTHSPFGRIIKFGVRYAF